MFLRLHYSNLLLITSYNVFRNFCLNIYEPDFYLIIKLPLRRIFPILSESRFAGLVHFELCWAEFLNAQVSDTTGDDKR